MIAQADFLISFHSQRLILLLLLLLLLLSSEPLLLQVGALSL